MKHKVSELQGAILDAAVAKAEEVEIEGRFGKTWRKPIPGVAFEIYAPSTDWAEGGPIIERERITTAEATGGGWVALIRGVPEDMPGQTPLIAAMRAYVASKFGEEVELP